jgi:uncharacterized membrane protein YphA (DoxX/SURF4 family)
MANPFFSIKAQLPKLVLELIVALLIILWLYTGINKLLDYDETRVQMGRSPFIESIAGFTAAAIPVGELILAILLLFGKTRLLGLFGSLFLMALFTGYIYLMLRYSYDLPCSCGGVLRQLSWQEHFYFNLAFTILCILGILLHSSKAMQNHIKLVAQIKSN